jgi:hypothetical protein
MREAGGALVGLERREVSVAATIQTDDGKIQAIIGNSRRVTIVFSFGAGIKSLLLAAALLLICTACQEPSVHHQDLTRGE